MWRGFWAGVAVVVALSSAAALGQIRPPDQNWVPPQGPVFTPAPPASPPPPTTQHGIDANGNAFDTTTSYRSGPFGTYTDHVTTTTYPPGNPALGTSITR